MKFGKQLVLAAALFGDISLHAATVVAPNNLTNVEGGGGALAFNGPQREQTVYNSANFLAAMPEGGWITEIAYRVDGGSGESLDTTVPPFEIRLSTTPSMSPSFPRSWDQNVGSDVRTVFSGFLPLTAEATSPGPSPFSVRIPLNEPFLYDPRMGNLLIDSVFSGTVPSRLVLDTVGDSSVVRHFGPFPDAASFSAAGYVLQLTFTQVPEPSTAHLLLLVGYLCGARFGIFTRSRL